ncbi:MAG: ribosomal protein S18-alanine N-acetyltransferase [Methanomicrobiales archaeon]|jgi:ribosomal-protein-alanine N-acetyltransferase|nr:ribosomal protein S18-alanine N-acetyltransferase [Methanomicrobiales archaeon]
MFRKARPFDLSKIYEIEAASFPDPWDEAVLCDCIESFPSTFLVATKRDEVVGFIAGGLEDTGSLLYGHICNFAVAPQHRREGIGRLLVKREEHQFAVLSASGVQLEVRAGNVPAQAFYQNLGYRQALRIAGYYQNGEDAVLMMKWFRF